MCGCRQIGNLDYKTTDLTTQAFSGPPEGTNLDGLGGTYGDPIELPGIGATVSMDRPLWWLWIIIAALVYFTLEANT